MIKKYELFVSEILDKDIPMRDAQYLAKGNRTEATHVHYCYHDETPNRPCIRVTKDREVEEDLKRGIVTR